jgi:hypothetical protein
MSGFPTTKSKNKPNAVGVKGMMSEFRLRVWPILPVMAVLAACGGGDDASKAGNGSVEAAADASVGDLAADASTADAMSVDVAAGGVEPMADPAAAAAAAEAAAAIAADPATSAQPPAAAAPPAQ